MVFIKYFFSVTKKQNQIQTDIAKCKLWIISLVVWKKRKNYSTVKHNGFWYTAEYVLNASITWIEIEHRAIWGFVQKATWNMYCDGVCAMELSVCVCVCVMRAMPFLCRVWSVQAARTRVFPPISLYLEQMQEQLHFNTDNIHAIIPHAHTHTCAQSESGRWANGGDGGDGRVASNPKHASLVL